MEPGAESPPFANPLDAHLHRGRASPPPGGRRLPG